MRLISIALTIMLMLAGTITVSAAAVLRVPQDFATIQAAVDNSLPGDMIAVSRGVFSENVLIMDKTDLRLRGANTVLDGSGVGGMGIGIEVVNSNYISIQNFIVEGYEAGIVLVGSHHSSVRNVETRFNDSNTASLRDGLQLVGSHHNHISNVDAHHNGHNGITLKEGSSDNTLQGNTANDNGQNAEVAANFGGCGIQLIGGGNHDNAIMENETLRNGWGIQAGGWLSRRPQHFDWVGLRTRQFDPGACR